MCLVVVAHQAHAEYPLVVAANRDEFHDRPTAPAGWWEDAPDVLAGRDLRAGGTWMGVTRTGRFAAVTNHRDLRTPPRAGASRGALVADFLRGRDAPEDYLGRLASSSGEFDGFNLLAAVPGELWYYSNRSGEAPRRLTPGSYGLSNALLDTPWPKVARGTEALRQVLGAAPAPEALLERLADRTLAAEHELPDTGVAPALERTLSAILIATPEYGTRSSTALLVDARGEVRFVERSLDPSGRPASERTHVFRIRPELTSRPNA
jgi:uncharacterized protein with NRDE domain